MKTRIYSAPAVKGLTALSDAYSLAPIGLYITAINSHNAEIFSYKPYRPNSIFQLEIIINVFLLHLYIYVMGRPNYFSAGIDFRRQNLTFTDVNRRQILEK